MDARQGNDRLIGYEGHDWMLGDAYAAPSNDTSTDGDDLLKGGPGYDGMAGFGGDDTHWGFRTGDYIFAEESSENKGEDTVNGGKGQDYIEAKDGVKDTINCGIGRYDAVFFDKGGIDAVVNCEYKNPNWGEFSVAINSTAGKVDAEKVNALRARY